VGTFGIANLDLNLANQRVEVAGHHANETSGRQLHGQAEVIASANQTIEYDLLTLAGLSGSPVWLAGAPDFLVGMHIGSNKADRFSERMVQEILQWRDVRGG
jgi:V8-like Glu-specific endopeptidase